MKLLKYLLCLFLFLPQVVSATDYVTKTATPTGNYTFSVDPDLGSSDTTISSQNAVKSYVDSYAAGQTGYFLTTRDVPALTNSTNLGLLSTGLLKITVNGGIAVVSTAVDGVDYVSPPDVYSFAGASGATGYLHPLILGSYYLWIASDGKLYIKSSAPVSDKDGTIVGTQS
jgi:hypothetical protein